MIREILIWPDPLLKAECAYVKEFGPDIVALATDLRQTMLSAKGAGLAAPQIGVPKRVISVLVRNTEAKTRELEAVVLCNPRIVEKRGSQLMREGCLSLPGFFDEVRRATWVRVEAVDEFGMRVEVAGDGVLAHALQHEIEHLDGIVFVDHLSVLKRNVAAAKFKKAKAKGMRYVQQEPTP